MLVYMYMFPDSNRKNILLMCLTGVLNIYTDIYTGILNTHLFVKNENSFSASFI